MFNAINLVCLGIEFQHIETWTKWPTLCRRHFQRHFPQIFSISIMIPTALNFVSKDLAEKIYYYNWSHLSVNCSTLRLERKGQHFANAIFNVIFLKYLLFWFWFGLHWILFLRIYLKKDIFNLSGNFSIFRLERNGPHSADFIFLEIFSILILIPISFVFVSKDPDNVIISSGYCLSPKRRHAMF